MEIVLQVETKDYQKVREILLKDDLVSRASISFREAKGYGGEGYYCFISGSEEQCKKALEITKEIAKEIKDKEKEKLISKIKEEESRALEGFGSIIG
ncbi:MAG: hypothetical protein NZ942_01500 [Candidatus Aenigmarchaeota archaeon]|nr:hypothetical protein [Candidatus Aenigmarchaeota archaeon]